MQTLILKIEYDGKNYHGWQVQPNGITVQECLEKAINNIYKSEIKIIGSGRTDSGVHSRGQIASAEINDSWCVPEHKICDAINASLPDDIFVSNAKIYDGEFHSRFDAIAREYKYYLHNKYTVFDRHFSHFYKYSFDLDLLSEAASAFIGKYDFTSFSKINNDLINPVCEVEVSEWKFGEGEFAYTIKANHFLYGMVRILVGSMLDVARGRKTIDQIKNSLNDKSRLGMSNSVSARGLVLERIYYPEKFGLKDF